MPTIKSAPFSFIRFEDLADTYCHGEAKYVLPAGNTHEAKFQFEVNGLLAITNNIVLGVNGTPFDPPVFARRINYLYRHTLQFFVESETFRLISFKLGDDEKEYNRLVTWPEFYLILKEDFGIKDAFVAASTEGYLCFTHPCMLAVEMVAAEFPDDTPETSNTTNYFWARGFVETPNTETPEGCFNYTLHSTPILYDPVDPEVTVIGVSNNFERSDLCFTSLLTYKNKENAFDFHYSYGEVNQVRLPFYLTRPAHPQKRSVYIKSDGNQLLLSANVEKEYQLIADWMIELFHECLTIALSHDQIIIENTNIREQTVKVIASEYSAEWNQEYELLEGPGKGKVKVANFGHTNDNCGCEEADFCGPVSGQCPLITNLAIGSITDNSAIASWTAAASPAINYEINLYRADTPGSPVAGYPKSLPAGVTAYEFTGLEAATAYQFQVRTNCGWSKSSWVELPADPDFTTL